MSNGLRITLNGSPALSPDRYADIPVLVSVYIVDLIAHMHLPRSAGEDAAGHESSSMAAQAKAPYRSHPAHWAGHRLGAAASERLVSGTRVQNQFHVDYPRSLRRRSLLAL